MSEEPALRLAGITRRFGALVALDDVSLSVRPGTVHALLGENGAGKTTLLRVAYGMTRADAGTIEVGGTRLHPRSPADAIAAGIGMVHQHFTLVPAMTVAENVALGRRGAYSPAAAAERVRQLVATTGFVLDPAAPVENLAVGAQQRVEIAKALARDARVLVLDEPTGVLAPSEVDDLLRWLRRFVEAGNAAVLITHKLREALAVADDVTVLRRGRVVAHGPARDMTEASLTGAMLGGETDGAPATLRAARGEGAVVFRAEGMSIADERGAVRVRDAALEVRAGEIAGVVGVEGSGQRELLRALAGRTPVSAGRLERPAAVGFIPEDRHHDAVMLDRPLVENVALRGAGQARGRLDWAALRARTRDLLAAFDVRGGGADTRMRALSGGNQQKLVLARELGPGAALGARGAPPEEHDGAGPHSGRHQATAPRILPARSAIVAENPTRGLDVRAAAAVHRRLREAAADGAAVVVYSGDLDEVLALADRVLVLFAGTVREVPVTDRAAVGRAMLGLG